MWLGWRFGTGTVGTLRVVRDGRTRMDVGRGDTGVGSSGSPVEEKPAINVG